MPLVDKLDDGRTTIKVEEAAKIVSRVSKASPHDRLVVANSVQLNVISNASKISRTIEFSGLSVYTYTQSDYEIEQTIMKSFATAGAKPTVIQRNLIGLLAGVLEFEFMVRKSGIPADHSRTNVVAAYVLALAASTTKLELSQREQIVGSLTEQLARADAGLLGDLADLISNEERALGVDHAYRRLNLRSNMFPPGWTIGTLVAGVSSIASVVTSILAIDEVIHLLEPVRNLGLEPDAVAFLAPFSLVPLGGGIAGAVAYRIALANMLKPKIDKAARDLVLAACEIRLEKSSQVVGE